MVKKIHVLMSIALLSLGAAAHAAPAAETADAEMSVILINTALDPATTLPIGSHEISAALKLEAKAMEPSPSFSGISRFQIRAQHEFQGWVRSNKIEKSLFTTSLLAMAALNVADYLSTKEALKYPGLQEGNPLMKPFVKNDLAFAAVKAGTTVLSYIGMKSLFKKSRMTAWVMSTAANFMLSYVVANNMRLIHQARLR
ncbi:MAG TPA: DUF5658 family protein [Candidatus Aminicenantes bacterium]|nr:DUF5658 family protein [Candidatus Aminicenantes bacterium]